MPEPTTKYNICINCEYHNKRVEAILFAPGDLHHAALLKTSLEREQQLKQREQEEMRRVEAGIEFDYEPHGYAWCSYFTQQAKQMGRRVLNPVTGEERQIYVLCVTQNGDGQCFMYKERTKESCHDKS
jgi:hypothetical protein